MSFLFYFKNSNKNIQTINPSEQNYYSEGLGGRNVTRKSSGCTAGNAKDERQNEGAGSGASSCGFLFHKLVLLVLEDFG